MTSPAAPAPPLHAAVIGIDHCTYVAAAEDEPSFIEAWARLGFTEALRLQTRAHPASHIALTTVGSLAGDRVMTGLSVSDDPGSPINEFVRRYGAGLQHVAYRIDPEVDMAELAEELSRGQVGVMTPPLVYRDAGGAELTQLFTPPALPYGPFTELVQRRPDATGRQFDGFSEPTIEDLYQSYEAVSRTLDRPALDRVALGA